MMGLKCMFVFGAAVGLVCAVAGSVFDDATAWWKFDQGGVDGALATASELHDARDASQNKPTGLYGASGGPQWSVMDVRLPNQKRTVRSTALYFPCTRRTRGSTNEYWFSSLAFSGLQNHGSAMTVVARVRLEGSSVAAADAILWNNAFTWSSNYGSAFGFIKGISGTSGSIVTYVPYAFIGKNSFGNAAADKTIQMKIGEWYDVAYLFSEETVDSVRYDVLTFVVADRSGIRTYTMRRASQRVASATTTFSRMGGMTNQSDWKTYNSTLSKNTGDDSKSFNGWVHQLAVWNRQLTLDEVKEAFGKPADHPEQDIYSDAVNWMRFDQDLNGDGTIQDDEIRDLRGWSRPQDGKPVFLSKFGPQGGPVWTNMTVDLPGRGASLKGSCLYFPITTNITVDAATTQTVYSAWPTAMRLANTVRAGSYTVMARIYPQTQPCAIANVNSFFYNNGLDWGNYGGSEFGLGTTDTAGNTFVPRFILAHSTYSASSLTMCTNNWYDIAFSVTDNGYDASGKALTDTAIVAVQDVQHGFRYQVLNVGTNAYTTFANLNQYATVGGEGAYSALTGFYNASTKTQLNYGNALKTYRGAIHEIAIWSRALTTNEIAEAFSHPDNMVMGVGTADGASGEFAGTDGSYDCNVDATGTVWRAVSGTLNADHPELTFRFTPEPNNVGLVHYLHIKAAEVGTSDGQKARLTLNLNGRSVATAREVGAFDDLWCALPRKMLQTGENVLKITYAGGTASTFALDNAAIVGSWQIGIHNNGCGEFSQEGDSRVSPNFVVGDRRLLHVCRALTSGWKNNNIRFYVPAELATRHAFTFTTDLSDYSDAVATNTSSAIVIDLNGTDKYTAPTGQIPAKHQIISFGIERGELEPGWNTFNMRYTSTANPGWLTFDFFKLEISDYNPGSFLILR